MSLPQPVEPEEGQEPPEPRRQREPDHIASAAEDYVKAPFSEEQIDHIEDWQHAGLGPLLCPNPHESPLGPLDRQLQFFEDGGHCPNERCHFLLPSVPHVIADGSLLRSARGLVSRRRSQGKDKR